MRKIKSHKGMHRDTFTTLEGSNTGEAHFTRGFTIIVVFVV